MSSNQFECNCGHRLALHTYFKDRTPCTLCRCSSFSTEPLAAEAPVRPRRTRRAGRYGSSTESRPEAERRPV